MFILPLIKLFMATKIVVTNFRSHVLEVFLPFRGSNNFFHVYKFLMPLVIILFKATNFIDICFEISKII